MNSGRITKKALLEENAELRPRLAEIRAGQCDCGTAEKSIYDSRNRFRILADNAPDMIYRIDLIPAIRFEYVNPAVAAINGYTPEDYYADSNFPQKIVYPEDMPLYEEMVSPRFIEGKIYVIRWYHKDGHIIWTESRNSLVRNGSGQVVAVEGIARDITRRKEFEKALARERDRARQLLDIAGVIILVLDLDRQVTLVNARAGEILGRPADEILGKDWIDNFVPERNRGALKEAFNKLVSGDFKPVEYLENPIINTSGEERLIAWHNSVIRDENGRIVGTLSSGEDITRRKQAERALRASEEKFRSIIEQSGDGFSLVGGRGEIIEWNHQLEIITGIKRDEVLGHNIWDVQYKLMPPELRNPEVLERLKKMTTELIKSNQAPWVNIPIEHESVRSDGEKQTTESNTFLVRAGTDIMIGSFIRNVSERRKTEEALRESEKKYRAIFENSIDGVLLTSPDGRVYSANTAACGIFGMTEEELINGGRNDVVDLSDPRLKPAIEERARTGRFRGELNFKRRDGSIFPAEISSSVFTDNNGDVRTVMIIRNVTERKAAEDAIKASEEKFKALFENAPVGIGITTASGKHIERNTVQCRLFGYKSREEMLAAPAAQQYVNPDDRKRYIALAKKDVLRDFEVEMRRVDGSTFWASMSAAPYSTPSGEKQFISVIQDISERKRAEQALISSHEELRNLSARLGEVREEEKAMLAREIHDEFGQALTALKMDLFWLGGRLPESQRLAGEKLEAMIRLVNELLSRVKKISTDLRPAMLDELGLVSTIEWASREFEKRFTIGVELIAAGEESALNEAQSTAVFRIFQETLTNIARHSGVSHVLVKINNDKRAFSISIEDNGRGITREQISSARSIGLIGMRERAAALGGKIIIKRNRGGGTFVYLTLPITEGADDKSAHRG